MVARRVDDPWAVPKGGMNEGETVQQATIRVAREKAGVSSCEEVANLGWIVVSKKVKQVAVQTFVLLAKELGTFASSSKERRRTWVPIEDAVQLLKKKPHEFSECAIERAIAYYRHSFSTSETAMTSTPLTRSVGGSLPTSPKHGSPSVHESVGEAHMEPRLTLSSSRMNGTDDGTNGRMQDSTKKAEFGTGQ